MKVDFGERYHVLDTKDRKWRGLGITYAANPLLWESPKYGTMVIFNSRDNLNRSEVWWADFDLNSMKIGERVMECKIKSDSFPNYASDGVSLGGLYGGGKEKSILFMGWKNPPGEHWFGQLGRFQIGDDNYFIVDNEPLIPLGTEDPVSISYGDSTTVNAKQYIWYGSTLCWDYGNGEMLHVIKVRERMQDFWTCPKIAITPSIGFAQAFSKPSVIQIEERTLMAFSFRGNETKYRIGFAFLDQSGVATDISWNDFGPSRDKWEDEMVEYPFLFSYKGELFMLYNGNGFGKTGFGITKLRVEN